MNPHRPARTALSFVTPKHRVLFGTLLLIWNALLLLIWIRRFHVSPQELAEAFQQFFLNRQFSWITLADNWLRFFKAGICLAGLLVFVKACGRWQRIWLGEIRILRGTVTEFALGLGVVGSLVLALGMNGLLLTPPRPASLVLLTAIALWKLRRLRFSPRGWRSFLPPKPGTVPLTRLSRIVLLLAAVITVAHVFSIEMGWDAITYHLRLPSFYMYHHKVYDVWHNFYSQFPAQIEMLFSLSMILEGDTLARFLNVALGVLFVLSIRTLADTVKLSSRWPVLLTVCSPLFMLLMTRAYIDLGVALYGTLAVLLFISWTATGARSAILVSGLMAGWCMGCKYVGILVPLAVLVAALPERKRPRFKAAMALFLLGALLPISVWLFKNWMLRGNPVAPFFAAQIGLEQALDPDLRLPFAPPTGSNTMRYGLLLRVEALYLDRAHIDGPILPLIAGLLPLLGLMRFPRRLQPVRRVVLAYLVGWFVLCPEVRFVLPIIPALGVLLGSCLDGLLASKGWLRSGTRIALEGSLIAGAGFGAAVQWITFAPFSMPLGLESLADKLRLGLRPRPFVSYTRDFVNAQLPAHARILYLCHFSSYYLERECLTDFHFGRAHITRLLQEYRTAPAIARRLRQLGVGWLLSTGNMAAQFAHLPGYYDIPESSWTAFKRFLTRRAEVAWQTNYFTLYRLGKPHPPRALPSFPVYEALAFRDAVKDLEEGRAARSLAALVHPPPLLSDVGSTHAQQGLALNALGRFGDATRAFERAMACGADTPQIRAGIARALLGQERYREALVHAVEARRLHPHSGDIAALLAVAHANLDHRAEARRLILEAIQRRPDFALYRQLADQFGAIR